MMRKNRIYAILVAVGAVAVLAGCQKQGDEPTPQPAGETVNVRFNTFLKEGDNVRPLNLKTRVIAGEGTLANGFYLYGHAHTKPFATSSGNTYTPIFENVKVNADGTYAIPKFWLQDKSLLYSFQAFAATRELGEVGPGTVTVKSGVPYVTSQTDIYLSTTDVLGAAVYDIKIGDETPTVNLYFEHRLGKLSLQMQRMNAGGPTLHNLRMRIEDATLYYNKYCGEYYWAPGKTIISSSPSRSFEDTSHAITLAAGEMKPVEAHSLILVPQTIKSGAQITLLYTLEQGPVSASNPEMKLTTTLSAMTLESGKQLNVVIGHIVETEQLVVQSVTLTDWVTVDKNVPEYK